MKKISVVVVGNCQARPVAQTLETSVPNLSVTGIAIVHLLKDSVESTYVPLFEAADIILAQRVTDDYPCSFVRSNNLRGLYGERVMLWPNLFYSGYNPELFYLRDAKRKPLSGPLSDYHNKIFFDAWKKGASVDEALRLFQDLDYNRQQYSGVPQKSLEELRKRELETDIQITDWMSERLWSQRLFFTFNHPAQLLITELCKRIVRIGGLEALASPPAIKKSEPLGQLYSPVNPWISREFNCTFEDSGVYVGKEVSVEESKIVIGKARAYSVIQVIEEFFRVYDACGMEKQA